MNKSFFDSDNLSTKINKLEKKKDCPSWLIHSLSILNESIDKFPIEEDDTRFITEYIYPH
jgi:hypothetical protein